MQVQQSVETIKEFYCYKMFFLLVRSSNFVYANNVLKDGSGGEVGK